MRGMLLHGHTASYLIAVEYLIEESGPGFEGGLYNWEGSLVPSMPITLSTSNGYILEQEDGRRGRINIVRQRANPEQPPLCWFRGHAGLAEP